MKLLISNSTQNIYNSTPKKYNNNISKGDNKKNLWTLPYHCLVNQHNWKYINEEELLGQNIKNVLQNKFNEQPTVILFWRCNTLLVQQFDFIKNWDVIKSIYLDDLHHSPEIQELKNIDNSFFDHFIIFSTYQYCFYQFIQTTNNKTFWLPHSFNELFTVQFNDNPKYGLLTSGNIDENIYPMRKYLLTFKNNYNIDYLNHPGYQKKKKHDIVGIKYIQKLNEYLACFTCCSTLATPYLLAKFFEIPGSGSLLVAYDDLVINQLKELGFIDGINYISVTKENMETKLDFIFDVNNKKLIDEIRLNGYNLIKNRHLLSHRSSFIDNCLKSYL